MSDKKVKYVSLKEVVDKILRDEGTNGPIYINTSAFYASMFDTHKPIITEDAEYEIVNPKQLPEIK